MVEHAARRGEPLVGQLRALGDADDDADDVAVAERDDEHRADPDAVRAQVVERPAQGTGRRDRLDLRDRRHRPMVAHGAARAGGGGLAPPARAPAYHRGSWRSSELPTAPGRLRAMSSRSSRPPSTTAEELRAAAEARANERIAEAERAAELRVRAADEEAAEVRAAAGPGARGGRGRRGRRRRGAPRPRPPRARGAGPRRAKGARELLYEARIATREVLRDGETISGHLRELSDSLRANAERLLLDIRAAHAEMTARLDRVDPDLGGPSRRRPRRAAAGAVAPTRRPRVPEFIPRRAGAERFRPPYELVFVWSWSSRRARRAALPS